MTILLLFLFCCIIITLQIGKIVLIHIGKKKFKVQSHFNFLFPGLSFVDTQFF